MSCCGGPPTLQKFEILEDCSPLGAYLNREEVERLASLCQVGPIKVGQPLPESPFYCIYTGQVVVQDESGDTIQVLCTKSAGAFFTRRAGLVKGRKKSTRTSSRMKPLASAQEGEASQPARQRTSIVKDFEDLEDEMAEAPKTSIQGKQAGKVLYITAENLEKFLFVCKPESQEVVKQITRTNLGTQLANVPFIEQCKDLEPADLRALGEICSYKTFDKGEVIFSQGDPALNFYIILKGTVDITVDVQKLRGSGDANASNVQRGVGQSFGVAALVYNAAERKYSATSLERSLCLVIARDNFGKFVSQKPSLEDTLMGGTKSFLLERYKAMNVPIFAELSTEQLQSAASLAKFKHFEAGDVIYAQGDPPSAFYVVLHGEVQMTSLAGEVSGSLEERSTMKSASTSRNADGSLVKETHDIEKALTGAATRTLTVGMHFGEVGVLLPSTPCIATCKCTKKATLLTLESQSFIQLFGTDLNLLAEMQIKLLRNNTTLRSALNHKKCRSLFEAHIKSEFSEESIRFYDAVASALATAALPGALEGPSKDTMATLGTQLVNEYVVDGCDAQVNIPGKMQKEIEAADKAKDLRTLFDKLRDAQAEIYLLMARDNWPRFIKSDPFAKLLADIGSYGEEVKGLVSEQDLMMLVQDGEGDGAGGSGGQIMSQHLQA